MFETDQFQPLIELGEQLSGARYGADFASDRALRILADHARAMTFLAADGVVPSNEDRGYVLAPGDAPRDPAGPSAGARAGLPEPLRRARPGADGRRLPGAHRAARGDRSGSPRGGGLRAHVTQGLATLQAQIEQARKEGRAHVPAEEVLRLHDTFGFPYEMTKELLAEEGLAIEGDFESLMDQQRARSRTHGRPGRARQATGADPRTQASAFAGEADFPTRFTGYETERQHTTVGAVEQAEGAYLVKLCGALPFYVLGGRAGGGRGHDRVRARRLSRARA